MKFEAELYTYNPQVVGSFSGKLGRPAGFELPDGWKGDGIRYTSISHRTGGWCLRFKGYWSNPEHSCDLAMDHLPNESLENTTDMALKQPSSRGINYLIITKLHFDLLVSKTRIDILITVHNWKIYDSFKCKFFSRHNQYSRYVQKT